MAFWFWTIVVAFVLIWYILVTVIVTIRGGKDIREMFRNMDAK